MPIKIAVISLPEMGHFLPMVHIAEELTSRGHDVSMITYECERQKCEQVLSSAGVKAIITKDGIPKEVISPGDNKVNTDAFKGFGLWIPYLKKEL